jgi:hypothetical protein
MDLHDLEITLEAALAVSRPTPRDVRDALVDYYAVVARPFIQKGLSHTHPEAAEPMVRRLLMPWETPTLADLRLFRERIDRYACVREDEKFLKTRRLMDDIMLAASVGERVRQMKAGRAPAMKLRVIEGGGEISQPRGALRVVRSETG